MSLARNIVSASTFAQRLANPANRLQAYISRSKDAFVNLSIEDYILRASQPDSTILFLYTNRPCIVIGRNQNPWSEVNLGKLRSSSIGPVQLVRRRSGGGTVFHDEGNLNWSITCPRADFTRDKHAEMVVRALRSLGVERARVNERHDIVLDQGQERRLAALPTDDTHRTAYTATEGGPRPLKVSGSAYKLTRGRALHHATLLLSSPNLPIISQFLRSPARDFIEAKGVESVSSPVANIGLEVDVFQTRLQQEFATMYAGEDLPEVGVVGRDYLEIPEVAKGYNELMTEDWMWSQTPQFKLTLQPFIGAEIELNVHHGIIKTIDAKGESVPPATVDVLRSALIDQKLSSIRNWNSFLRGRIDQWHDYHELLARHLESLLPVPDFLAP